MAGGAALKTASSTNGANLDFLAIAAAISENGIGTSFVDGGALDVFTAVIIGRDNSFEILWQEGQCSR